MPQWRRRKPLLLLKLRETYTAWFKLVNSVLTWTEIVSNGTETSEVQKLVERNQSRETQKKTWRRKFWFCNRHFTLEFCIPFLQSFQPPSQPKRWQVRGTSNWVQGPKTDCSSHVRIAVILRLRRGETCLCGESPRRKKWKAFWQEIRPSEPRRRWKNSSKWWRRRIPRITKKSSEGT